MVTMTIENLHERETLKNICQGREKLLIEVLLMNNLLEFARILRL